MPRFLATQGDATKRNAFPLNTAPFTALGFTGQTQGLVVEVFVATGACSRITSVGAARVTIVAVYVDAKIGEALCGGPQVGFGFWSSN